MTTPQKKMFDRIKNAKSPVLELSLVGSGGGSATTLRQLIGLGLVIAVDHPSVIDRRTNSPAAAFSAAQ